MSGDYTANYSIEQLGNGRVRIAIFPFTTTAKPTISSCGFTFRKAGSVEAADSCMNIEALEAAAVAGLLKQTGR
jgi:hypothetical protein